MDTAPAAARLADPVADETYPIDDALQDALRDAEDDQAATSAALLDLAIRWHRLFGSLVAMLRTGHVRIEEPRRMSVTAKAALLGQDAPAKSPLARSCALARLIVHDLDVPDGELDVAARRALLLARECLPRAPRRTNA